MPETGHLVRFNIIISLILSSLIFSQTHPNTEIDSILKSGINQIILQDYNTAEKTFTILEKKFPKLPLGNIYLAAVKIAKAVDYEEELSGGYVDSLLVIAENKSENLLENNNDNLWYNYYYSLIYGYKAYYNSIIGNIISAFADGVMSLRSYQKCLEIDKEFYESYIALGTYQYWKSAQSKSLLWIPFVSNNRSEGISNLEKAIKHTSYNKHLAAYSLVWIYIDYGESKKAIDLSLKMLEDYENSRYFKWGLARAYQDVNKAKAITTYYELLKSIESIPNQNQYNEIVLRHKIAMLYYEIGEYDKSLKLCNEILDFNIKSDKIKERLKVRINRTIELKENLLEKMNYSN